MNKKPIDYREQILAIYERRTQRNSAYSLTAFARDLNIGVSTLSMILNKKRGLSFKSATRIANLLGFCEIEKKTFLSSVLFYSSRLQPIREQNHSSDPLPKNISPKGLPFNLNWRHLALREMVALPHFEYRAEWLAEKLSLSEENALAIWNDCLQSSLIVLNDEGKFCASEHLVFGEQGPSQTIRTLHKDLLNKAIEKIDLPFSERSLSVVLITVSERQYDEVKRLVSNFNTEMSRAIKINDLETKDRVLCVGTQIFSL